MLKTNGRCLITWFLWQHAQQPPIFKHRHSKGWYSNPALIEEAIAFDTSVVFDLYKEAGLHIERIETGSWSGVHGLSHQDIILASKG